MQMFKLAANPKFREGARRVIEEMRNAGINITSEVRDLLPFLFFRSLRAFLQNAFELFGMKPPSQDK